METTRNVSNLDPHDRSVVERVFGQRLAVSAEAVLILRVNEQAPEPSSQAEGDEVPLWCNVLEGLSDEDLAEFSAALKRRSGSPSTQHD
jgi:hypothetical protein